MVSSISEKALPKSSLIFSNADISSSTGISVKASALISASFAEVLSKKKHVFYFIYSEF